MSRSVPVPEATGPVPPERYRVAVVGAGSWGTALAIHAARAGREVTMWGHDAAKVEAMGAARENVVYLPGFEFPEGLQVSSRGEVLGAADLVISAVPSRHLRAVWAVLGDALERAAHLVSATKGIEEGTGLRMTELLADVLPAPPRSLSALSGPSFARELAEGYPTAITLGCADDDAGL